MIIASAFTILSALLFAQVPNPTQQQRALTPAETGQPLPVYRVTVVSRTIRAVNYQHRTGTTKVDFRGTPLMPQATGEAKVESRMGSTKIDTEIRGLEPASKFGPEFLTYVLWAVTPEGRAQNAGELVLEGDKAKLLSTTELQAFGLLVTAEPYFAVTQPSDVVVLENLIRPDTRGTIQQVDAKYELLKRGVYTMNRTDFRPVRIDPKGPLQLAEAQNAVMIAGLSGAERYAADTFQKAQINLRTAQGFSLHKGDRKNVETAAREAVQMAEDSRIIALKRIEEERLAAERAAAAEREERARLKAQQETRRRAEAEAERAAAERAKREAEEATLRAQREKAEADAARGAALAQQQAARAEAERARLAADEANRARQQAETEKVELRHRLQQQLNIILETHDTARGLIVNMSDVLFDTGQATLKPGAREKLAKVSGILLTYPSLKIEVEGHTDNVGGEEYNQRLSEHRAEAVREYLIRQGVHAPVTARGFGKTMPVASNNTVAGRQLNRRVELVVSGEVIGGGPSGP